MVENHRAAPTVQQRLYDKLGTGVTLPQEAILILNLLLSGIQEALGNNLVGVYLRGSLVMGDFDPETSDIDFFTVTEHAVSDMEFAALTALHVRLDALPNRYGDELEGPYISRSDVKRFQSGQRHPTIARGGSLLWREHGNNWILERWTVREHGITLLGPDPKTLIAPVSSDELRAAVRTRLSDWVDYANDPDDPGWLGPRGGMAYAVETMCRALCSLATGELPSKQRAVAWALKTIPKPWHSTVERSQIWRIDNTVDPDIVLEVRRFIYWAASTGESTVGT